MVSHRFDDAYARSLDDPEGFWGEAAGALDWHVQPQRALDPDAPRWRAGSPAGSSTRATTRSTGTPTAGAGSSPH